LIHDALSTSLASGCATSYLITNDILPDSCLKTIKSGTKGRVILCSKNTLNGNQFQYVASNGIQFSSLENDEFRMMNKLNDIMPLTNGIHKVIFFKKKEKKRK